MRSKIIYKVESVLGSWFCVRATKQAAKHLGVEEFGRGNIGKIHPATLADVGYYESVKGPIDEI